MEFASLKNKKRKTLLSVLLLALLCVPKLALADAWWGEGYRSPEWVVANGGAILYYDCSNRRGDVTVDLYTAGGAVIETERGKSGIFDDALAGKSYYLKAKDEKEKFKSAVFTLKKGSTNYVTLDFKKEKAKFNFGATTWVLGLQKAKPKPAIKAEPAQVEPTPPKEEVKEPFETIQDQPENAERLEKTEETNSSNMVDVPKYSSSEVKVKRESATKEGWLGAIFDMGALAIIFLLGGSLIFVNSRRHAQKMGEEKDGLE